MNYYLIDYENQGTDNLKDMYGVQKGDEIYIFFSDKCKNFSLDLLEKVSNLGVNFKPVRVKCGAKNALDFQLSSHLGYLIGKDGNLSSYHIISNDKGFDCIVTYWNNLGISVDRTLLKKPDTPIKPSKAAKKKSKVNEDDLATIDEIQTYLDDDEVSPDILDIINQYKTKTAINNGIVKAVKDTRTAGIIYKKLKPLLTQKNKK